MPHSEDNRDLWCHFASNNDFESIRNWNFQISQEVYFKNWNFFWELFQTRFSFKDFKITVLFQPKKYATCLAKYKSQLTNGFTLLKVKKKAKTALDLLPDDVKVKLPKYARVNKLISTFEKALDRLAALGYSIKRPDNGGRVRMTSYF